MPTTKSLLQKLRKICLALPDAHETITWGKPHFRVKNKIFCGFGDEDGKPVAGFKLEMAHAAEIINDDRFWRAPYVGHKGWVSMDLSTVTDWDEVRCLILESFQLIAPKRTLAKLDGTPDVPKTPKKKADRTRTPAAKKSATKKSAAKKSAAKKSAAKKPVARKTAAKKTTGKGKKATAKTARQQMSTNARKSAHRKGV